MMDKFQLLQLMQKQVNELADKTGIDRCAMLLNLFKELKALYELLEQEDKDRAETGEEADDK